MSSDGFFLTFFFTPLTRTGFRSLRRFLDLFLFSVSFTPLLFELPLSLQIVSGSSCVRSIGHFLVTGRSPFFPFGGPNTFAAVFPRRFVAGFFLFP